jgi:histidinol-phosphate aminotransferase
MTKLYSKFVVKMKPYDYKEKRKEGLRLDWNESTIPPSPHVIEKIREFLDSGNLNAYPNTENEELLTKLSRYVGAPTESILTFNGSDSALDCVAKTFIDVGDKAVYVCPTYDNFRICLEMRGAEIHSFFFDDMFVPSINQLIKFVQLIKPKLVYLVNPNNPTGTMFKSKEIEQFLKAIKNTVLVIDEAYVEFNKECSSESLVNKYDNLVVTRTFSKAFCLASVRCGYAIANPETISMMKKVRNMKEVNQIAQVAVSAALDDLLYMFKYVEEVNTSKILLYCALTDLCVPFKIGGGNFFLMQFRNPHKIQEHLKEAGIFIRDRSDVKGLEGFLRVSIGDVKTTEKFIGELTCLIQKLPWY